MLVYPLAPGFGEAESRYRNLPVEGLVHPNQPGRLEFADVAGKVPFGQTGESLQIEEVGGATGSQSSEDGQASRFVDEPIELGQFESRSRLMWRIPQLKTGRSIAVARSVRARM